MPKVIGANKEGDDVHVVIEIEGKMFLHPTLRFYAGQWRLIVTSPYDIVLVEEFRLELEALAIEYCKKNKVVTRVNAS